MLCCRLWEMDALLHAGAEFFLQSRFICGRDPRRRDSRISAKFEPGDLFVYDSAGFVDERLPIAGPALCHRWLSSNRIPCGFPMMNFLLNSSLSCAMRNSRMIPSGRWARRLLAGAGAIVFIAFSGGRSGLPACTVLHAVRRGARPGGPDCHCRGRGGDPAQRGRRGRPHADHFQPDRSASEPKFCIDISSGPTKVHPEFCSEANSKHIDRAAKRFLCLRVLVR